MKTWFRHPCFILAASVAASAFFAVESPGAPVSPGQARVAVASWMRSHPSPLGVPLAKGDSTVRTAEAADGTALFHVVDLPGGGFVVTSADDSVTPIVAFSGEGRPAGDGDDPLWRLLEGDMEMCRKTIATAAATPSALSATAAGTGGNRAAWAALLNAAPSPEMRGAKLPSAPAGERVPPLMGSKWGQGNAGGGRCYNYYTPHNYLCGCVATAMAQIMRFHGYPTQAIEAKTFTCAVSLTDEKKLVATNLTMFGGTYAWDDMPLRPDGSLTEAQRSAIGKLTYDCGVATRMNYTAQKGSMAIGGFVHEPLMEVFQFGNAMSYLSTNGISRELFERAICPGLDAGYPAFLGISAPTGAGHAIVSDGYGYEGEALYFHLNLGWNGVYDAWYCLPDVDCDANNKFTSLDSIAYNIFPSGGGEIISGRVLDAYGNPVTGATVSVRKKSLFGTSDEYSAVSGKNGIYAVRVTTGGSWSFGGGGGTKFALSASKQGYTSPDETEIKVTASVNLTSVDWSTGNVGGWSSMAIGNSWGNDIILTREERSLEVESAYGTPSPPAGRHRFGAGESVTASAGPPAEVSDGTRMACSGWTGSGSVPPSGTGTVVTFSLETDSSIVWNWRTEHLLSVSAGPGGTVDAESGWRPEGASTRIAAAPDGDFIFYAWEGDTDGCDVDGGTITVPADRPRSVAARFSDRTRTTPAPVPYGWLKGFWPDLASTDGFEAAALGTASNRDLAVWECYVAGLDPTDPLARLLATIDPAASPVIGWIPDLGASRVYTVEGKTCLRPECPWREIPAFGKLEDLGSNRFFRVKVNLPAEAAD